MRKIRIIIAFLLIISLFGCGMKKESHGLSLQGNCNDNMSDFLDGSEVTIISDLSQAYLKNINYEITNIDEDKMVATMNVEVPNVTDKLTEIIHSIVEDDGANTSYIELRSAIEDEFIKNLLDGEVELETTTIQIPIEDVDGVYKIVPNDEWIELIYENIVKAYLEAFSNIGGEY